jgi:hypothetical protein
VPKELKGLSKEDKLLAEQLLTTKEQRKADWAIIKNMSGYLWPKDNLGTRFRVGLSVGLLVGAKLLNVQVPFYFKSIVDSMNIDFIAMGGTAWTVAGSMVVACKLASIHTSIQSMTEVLRRCDAYGCHFVPGTPQCCVRQCGPEGDSESRLQCLRALAAFGPQISFVPSDGRFD